MPQHKALKPHRPHTHQKARHASPSKAKARTLFTVLGLAASFLTFHLLTGAAQADAPIASTLSDQFNTAPLAADYFTRTAPGFGTADLGGSWNDLGEPTAVSDQGSYGLVDVLAPGTGTLASLPAAQAADVDVQATISLPTAPPSSAFGAYPGLQARVGSDGSAYQVFDYVQPNGRTTLTIQRVNAGNVQALLANVLAPFTLTAGETYHVEMAVANSSKGPIVVARTWLVGTTVPDWQVATTDADQGRQLTASGGVGVMNYTESGSSAPITTRFESFVAYSLNAKSSAAPVAPTNAVSSLSPIPTPTPSSSAAAPTSPASTPTSSSATPAVSTPAAPVTSPGTAGSAPVGTTSYPVPSGAVFVATNGSDSSGTGTQSAPFATIQTALNRLPTNGTIVLRGGTYHQSAFISGIGITIQSYPNEAVWLDGSSVVSGWTQQGSTWVHSGWTSQFDSSIGFSFGGTDQTFIDPAYPLASHPDQVFLDGSLLQLVSGTPGPGQFAVNYGNQTLTIGSNPNGHELRASDLQSAITIAGSVTLRGFGVERYATSMPQMGTIYEGGSTGRSTFQNLVVVDNAVVGINLSQGGNLIDHVTADRNGMSGIEIGTGGPVITNQTIQYSELSANNTHHFNGFPAAAGIKVSTVNGLVIRGNVVKNNQRTDGIWTDQNTTNFTIVDNVVTSDGTRGKDATTGIMNELSDSGIVAGNVISGFQEGITMFDTGDVKIINNTVYNNSTWGIGLTQDDRYVPGHSTEGPSIAASASNPWLIRNETVQNNVFADSPGGMFQFYVLDKSTNRPASSMNLDVEGNLFTHKDTGSQPTMVGWGGSDNVTVANYQTPADFAAGVGQAWVNAQTPTATAITAMASYLSTQAAVARPLSADVAAALGVAAGTQHLGAF